MKTLALEFSSKERSVALWDGSGGLPQKVAIGRGSSSVLDMVDEALREAGWRKEEIQRIVVGLGPGSYTGIRAAISTAQGWQLANSVKLSGVNSAEALAHRAFEQGAAGDLTIAIDAQRGEFYTATYRRTEGGVQTIAPLRIEPKDAIDQLVSDGANLIGPELGKWFSMGEEICPDARSLAALASRSEEFVDGTALEPVYLRETNFVKAPPPRAIPDAR